MTGLAPEPSPELIDEMELEADQAETNGEIIIVGAEECPNCGAVKILFEEELEEKSARYVDIGSDEGRMIDDLFGHINAVPFVAYHNKATGKITECDLTPEGESMGEAVWAIAFDLANEEKSRTIPTG